MNLLSTIIERLNQRVEAGNIFDQIYGLCELSADGNDKAWIHYIGNGQAVPVTNFDAKQGTIFWAKRGKISVSKNESLKLAGCKALYETKFTLSAYAVVRKDHLPCDSADAQDWIASRVLRLVSGSDPQFKTAIGVVAYEVVPNGYINEIKSLTANYEWACVSIDIDVNVLTSSEDGCYDTCATGDIPLPDFLPCTPCLTEVAVDGITIIGNGTVGDPLIAIGGGGGGGALIALPFTTDHLTATGNAYAVGNIVWYLGNVYRCIAANDSILPTNATYWVSLGAGFPTVQQPSNWNATSGNNQILNKPTIPAAQVNSDWNASSGVAEILNKPTIPAAQSLQDVTDVGNTTDNDIQFDAGVGVLLDNTSRLREGTIDAGLGGTKGIAQICAVGYELKWEAGRLYVMDGNGILIRWSLYNFTITPTVNDDNTKGYITGSRWSLDDGTVYLCSDGTTGAAVWTLQTVGSVTDVTATAPLSSTSGSTPDISISQSDGSTDGYLSSTDWNTFDGKFDVPTGSSNDYLDGTGAIQPFPSLGMQGGQATGTDTYAVSIGGVTSYNLNDAYAIGFTNANTGASTLNINGLGVVNISKNNVVPIIGGDIAANQQFIVIYDGTNFQILGVAPNQMFAYVTNADSVTINKGQPVYAFGATGDRMTVKLANNSSEATSSKTIGLVFSSSIGANQKGYIITQGVIDGINTNAFNAGDTLYVGNTAGSLTKVLPLAPNHLTRIGIVERANAGNGQIYVFVQNGFQLDELSDVDITTVTPVNNDFLVYTTGASNLWKNRSLGNVLGGTTSQYVRGDGSLATFPSLPLLYKDLNNQTAVTGVTTNTKVVGVLIPANTITVGAIVEIKARMTKPAGNGLMTLRVYANTADSIVTPAPTLLITAASGNINQNYTGIDRTAIVKSATVTQTASATSSVLTDASTFQGVVTNSNIDWTAAQYLIFAIQNGSAADATTLSYYEITIK